jgi:opacity protein-like surface antigen
LIQRLALVLLLGGVAPLYSQAIPTASRLADVQVGVGYSAANPDYVHQTFQGFAIYGDYDFRRHLGIEGEFHQVYSGNGDLSLERTYDIGARYFRTYGPFVPYVKGMYGRGDFKYPFGYTELGYNMFVGGGGVDFKFGEFIHIRGEYEYQKWISFPNGGFHPQIVTVGVAYHFSDRTHLR